MDRKKQKAAFFQTIVDDAIRALNGDEKAAARMAFLTDKDSARAYAEAKRVLAVK